MGSATVRRFALVAALVLLVPLWCRPAVDAQADDGPSAVVIRLAAGHMPAAPAIRRHVASGWWLFGSRTDQVRTLAALAVVGLLSLLRLVPWSALAARRSVPSPLARRRHAIALRAPPLPTCA